MVSLRDRRPGRDQPVEDLNYPDRGRANPTVPPIAVLMRRAILLTALVVSALVPAIAHARASAVALTIKPQWFGSTRQLFVDTSWTPGSAVTTVTLVVTIDGSSLRTMRGKRWVIGRKLFSLDVPGSVRAGAKAKVTVRVRSSAGSAVETATLTLR